MPTIIHTQPQENTNLGQGYTVVQWQGLNSGSTLSDWFTCAGWVIGSVEWLGTPGGGTPSFIIQGSNQLQTLPTSGTTLTAFTATVAGLIIPSSIISCARIRPIFTGGDGSTNMTCMVLLTR